MNASTGMGGWQTVTVRVVDEEAERRAAEEEVSESLVVVVLVNGGNDVVNDGDCRLSWLRWSELNERSRRPRNGFSE